MQNCLLRVLVHGQARVMRVMAARARARARARVPVFKGSTTQFFEYATKHIIEVQFLLY